MGEPSAQPKMEVPELLLLPPNLNPMQLAFAEDLLRHDRNVVICAPSCAGKSVAFLMAMVRLLSNANENAAEMILPTPSVVFLSPFRSRCSKVFEAWRPKLNALSVEIGLLTGSDCKVAEARENEDDLLNKAHVLVTTFEKFHNLLAAQCHQNLMSTSIQLVLIDQLQHVASKERGRVFEAIVAQMKLNRRPGQLLRFIGTTSIAANVEDFGEWFDSCNEDAALPNVEPSATYFFEEDHRPVPMKKIVLSFPTFYSSGGFRYDELLDNYLLSVVQKYWAPGEQVLVVSMTKPGAEETARRIGEHLALRPPSVTTQEVVDKIYKLSSSDLKNLVLKHGVAYHHGGLSDSDKITVAELFTLKFLSFICSTGTLAFFDKIQASLVIAKSTTIATKLGDGPWTFPEFSDIEFGELLDRVGRPFDDSMATAVVITHPKTINRYQALRYGDCFAESSLDDRSLIGLWLQQKNRFQGHDRVSIFISWLKCTFHFQKLSNERVSNLIKMASQL